MKEQPTAAQLLRCAGDLLKTRVLPQVAPGSKRDVLMILNALSIAQRELAQGELVDEQERNALTALLQTQVDDLTQANRALADMIRHGAAGPHSPVRGAVFEHLKWVTLQRVLTSNPKALGSSQG